MIDHSRRVFLQGLGVAAAAGTVPAQPLATVKFGKVDVTRLIIGSNPFYGYSHFNPVLNGLMREWMTQDRRIEVLKRAEQAGINTWQVHYNDATVEDLRRYRGEGGTMHWLLLGDFELMKNWKLLAQVAKLNAIGVAHHGNRTDEKFETGKIGEVYDFVKAVQDAGMPGGISTHNPAVVEYVEEHGWKNDYYMTCMYRVTRSHDEAREQFGEAPLGELYYEKDPERMCAMVRKTRKTCFAFKLLGAGRNIGSPQHVEDAFRYVLGHIKAQDAVIVGMFPKFRDEVRENADLVRRITLAS